MAFSESFYRSLSKDLAAGGEWRPGKRVTAESVIGDVAKAIIKPVALVGEAASRAVNAPLTTAAGRISAKARAKLTGKSEEEILKEMAERGLDVRGKSFSEGLVNRIAQRGEAEKYYGVDLGNLDAKQTVGLGIETGSILTPFGKISKGIKGIKAAEEATRAQNIAKYAGGGAIVGSAGGAGVEAQVEGATAGDIVKGGLIGGTLGSVLGGAGGAIKKSSPSISKLVGDGDSTKPVGKVDVPQGTTPRVDDSLRLNPEESNIDKALKGETPPAERKQRGLSKRIASLVPDFEETFGDIPGYDVRNIPKHAKKAEDLFNKNKAEATELALKGGRPKNGSLPEEIYVKVAKDAKERGDYKLLAELVYSPIAEGATVLGQRLRTLAELDANNPLSLLKKVARGKEKYIAKELKGDSEKIIRGESQKIKAELEISSPIKHQDINKKVVEKLSKEVPKEEKLAKKVIAHVSPAKKKKQQDIMVNELTKIAKETLPAKGKTAKTSVIERVKVLFGGSDEAKRVYESAKDIVRAKFKDNPEITRALKEYDDFILKNPISQKTVRKAVLEELKSKETTINKIIRDSVKNQKSSRDDIVKSMTENGFSKEAAEAFSELASKEIDDMILSAKKAKLSQMTRDKGRGIEKQTLEDKINKLSNLGALDDADYLDLARSKLGVNITQEESKTILELSNKLQVAKEAIEKGGDRLEYGRLKVALMNFVNKAKHEDDKFKISDIYKHPGESLTKFGGLTKSMTASMDNSSILRQGWKTLFAHNKEWRKNAIRTFDDISKALGGKNVLDEVDAEIVSRPNALNGIYDKMKLAVGAIEEAYPTSAPAKIPYVGRVFKASEAAYTGFLHRMRADVADKYLEIAKRSGVDINDKKELEAIGKMVNALTGRGHLGKLEPIADTLNNVFFSPRNLKSNIDTITAHSFQKGVTPFVRKQAAINLLKIASGSAAVLAIAKAINPDSVEVDPRSSDFGKIVIGSTRFDVSGGSASIATLASRIMSASSKSSSTGKVSSLTSGDYGSSDSMDVIYNFFENKTSPVATVVKDILKGKDFSGEKPTVFGEASKLGLPIGVSTLSDLRKTEEAPLTVMAMIAEIFGIGINTYSIGSSTGKKPTIRIE